VITRAVTAAIAELKPLEADAAEILKAHEVIRQENHRMIEALVDCSPAADKSWRHIEAVDGTDHVCGAVTGHDDMFDAICDLHTLFNFVDDAESPETIEQFAARKGLERADVVHDDDILQRTGGLVTLPTNWDKEGLAPDFRTRTTGR
jgi:hypothetical protein